MHVTFKAQIRKALYGIMLLGMVLYIFGTANLPVARAQDAVKEISGDVTRTEEISLTLDDVIISIQASNLPSADFVVSEPGAKSQVATSVAWKPFRELSVIAIPYGYKPGTEALPGALSGGKDIYDILLRNYRVQQGGKVQDGPTVTLFGKQITGLHTVVELPIDGPIPKPIAIEEWVVEAGNRLWIIRASEEQLTNDLASQSVNFLEDLVLRSSTLGNPSTISDQPTENLATDFTPDVGTANLPLPSWWDGDCDYNTYYQKSGGRGSYRLGAVYLGMPACGPRPWFDDARDVLVHFFQGSWGVLEWECVELGMRFLYLMYGIPPYQANGSQVVWNYSGDRLVQIPNGIEGKLPQPGDVMSYGPTTTSGHVSVVTSSNVDRNGNGTITVIDENNSVSGSSTLSVKEWSVLAFVSVSGWLHDEQGDCPQSGGVILYWNTDNNCINSSGDAGYRQRTSTGWQNVTDGSFDDKASSVMVPSGWAVMLYEHADKGGGKVCFNSDISDFGTLGNFPGTGTSINDQVSSMEVFSDSNCVGDIVPSSPNPSDGTILGRTNDTWLYWSTNGTSCSVHVWGGSIDNTSEGCSSLHLGSQRGGAYSWQITASNSEESANGPVWHFNIRPYAPTNLNAAAASLTQITLNWSLSSDEPSDVDSYNIYSNGTQIANVPNNTTGYSVPDLTCNTKYFFYVKTVRQGVESNTSNTATATTHNCNVLSVSKTGTGSGTVTSSPAGINCGATCSASFNYNTSVTLTATASTGSTFTGWSGAGCIGTGTCIVTMNAVKSVTATFTLNTYTISGYVRTSGGVRISGVTMSGLPGSPTPTTDANGYYSGTVDYNWSGTVTPQKSGYIFTPTSRSYNSVTSKQTVQNYTGRKLPGAFSKSSPVNAATNRPIKLTLKWGTSSRATSYEYCIDTSNDSVCDTGWVSTGTAKVVSLSGLLNRNTYYWQVRAKNAAGTTYANGGGWWSFTTLRLTPRPIGPPH